MMHLYKAKQYCTSIGRLKFNFSFEEYDYGYIYMYALR